MISVGIDVSKNKSTVCIMKPNGEVLVKPYEITHTQDELSKLVEKILGYEENTRVVLEATGAYHLPVAIYISNCNIFISVINPLAMKKYAARSIRKGKTDKLDSIQIANYGIDNWYNLREYALATEKYDELNTLVRQYSQYVSLSIQSKIMLINLLDKTMPGITNLLRNHGVRIDKDKLNSFVKAFWHYDNICRCTEKQFVARYLRWAKKEAYHQNEAKAKTIYSVACQGIPTINSNTPSTKMIVLESVRVLREVTKTLHRILTHMQELAKSLKEYDVVRSMGGVGDKLAPRIIACIGDVTKFHSSKALIAFAGIDAPPFQSGSFNGTNRHISKRGSSYLRKTGFEIMQSIKRTKPENDAVYDFIIKKELEGKPKKVAKIASDFGSITTNRLTKAFYDAFFYASNSQVFHGFA